MSDETVSFEEWARQDRERRARELPWTAADEARLDAKRAAEHAAREAWAKAHPPEDDEDDDDDGES
jgi:hypothetical protein